MIALWIVLVLVVLGALLAVAAFNDLVRRRNRTAEAWSQIDVELTRRHDLIPNLVRTVTGYATHESATLETVTRARSAALDARATGDRARIAKAENELTETLHSLFALAENYPRLRAVEGFTALQEQLTATEDKIEYARRYYNTSVRDYNTALQTFPRSLLARWFHFRPAAFFEADDGRQTVPTVDFSDR